MDNEVKEFLAALQKKLVSIDYIKTEDIPNIGLYMDQVTTFMDEQLEACKRCRVMVEADMEKKWERDMDRPSVPPKPQNRYIQRWKTSVILVPRVEHCPIRWEIVSATSNLAMEKSWQLFPGAGTMK